MMTMTLAFLVGCAPQPASIQIDGEAATVHTTDAVGLPAATVLDAQGAALATQPQVTWTVTPDTVAKLEGDKLVPLTSGEAVVQAAVGELHADWKLVVALPDRVTIGGYDAAQPFPVGETRQLVGQVLAGDIAVQQPITWTVDNAAVATVDESGLVTAVAEGAANVTATSGTLTSVVAITVVPALPAAAAID